MVRILPNAPILTGSHVVNVGSAAVGVRTTVQQSTYASLFRVLPIGILRIIRNVLIMLAMFFSKLTDRRLSQQDDARRFHLSWVFGRTLMDNQGAENVK